MHKFVKEVSIENARVAVRSDASVWLMAHEGTILSLNRNDHWIDARRIRLCAGDRIRIDQLDVSLTSLCDNLGINLSQASNVSDEQNNGRPVPLSVPSSVIDNARRNSETGQIEKDEP